ncbi:MAG: heme ABC transporter ATP-binding protein [Deltaproteobacteria bacterium]|nr:heme ABC transporter ATP-binding protein [Deltaproteobacteria bacterium]
MSTASAPTVLELREITKRFPGVLANDHINLDLREGEIHTILGENGAGKSTLMSIIAGLYTPDEGEIRIRGQVVQFSTPREAISQGIGMVFQHFMLVRNHTVAENIILGLPGSAVLDLEKIHQEIQELSDRYDLHVDPERKIHELSVGEQQRVEIVKVLYRGARLLILDEPTAVLTPQESEALYRIMRNLTQQEHSILFISHKMKEVMALSDRVTVLNQGRVMATLQREDTSPEQLAAFMLGHTTNPTTDAEANELPCTEVVEEEADVPTAPEAVTVNPTILELRDVHAVNDLGHPVLKGISLELRENEILGMAGVSGNGQRELTEVLAGLRTYTSGTYLFEQTPLQRLNVEQMINRGVGYIPEDRKKFGVAAGLTIAQNFLLRNFGNSNFFWKRFLINRGALQRYGREKMEAFDVRAPSEKTRVGLLSGGNMQKVILARETSRARRVLLACQPTRGLDIHATQFIRDEIGRARDRGLAVLWISEDLDELLLMADRIAVIFDGHIVGTLSRQEATVEQIGRMMTGMTLETAVPA